MYVCNNSAFGHLQTNRQISWKVIITYYSYPGNAKRRDDDKMDDSVRELCDGCGSHLNSCQI